MPNLSGVVAPISITITVVICTLHNVEGLEKCINCITQQEVKPKEVIIVHGDIDNKLEESVNRIICPILQSNLISLKYLKTIRSLVMQRNIGIDNACGDVIVFLDDDVILEKDYFYHLMEAYQSKWSESLGGVQGTIIQNDRAKKFMNSKEILKQIFLLGGDSGRGKLLPSVKPSFLINTKEIQKVDIFNGCMMSFRRNVLVNNRFDTNLKEFWVLDDIELSYRISRKYELYQAPQARLYHVSSTPNYEGLKKIACMSLFNRLYVFRLYFSDSRTNWILFFWSNIGELLYMTFMSIKKGSIGPISGFFEGCKLIFKSKGYPYRKIIKRGE